MEEWKSIIDFPGYQISSYGNVRNITTNKFLRCPLSKQDNYFRVSLSKNGKAYTFLIHRLIATHFIPNTENKELVDHINRVRTDNRIENLRWATHSENNQNFPLQKNNKLKQQYISKHHKGYMFEKIMNKQRFLKYFKELEDAIAYRDNFLASL